MIIHTLRQTFKNSKKIIQYGNLMSKKMAFKKCLLAITIASNNDVW